MRAQGPLGVLELIGIGDDDEVTLLRAYGEDGKPAFYLEGNLPLSRWIDRERVDVRTLVLGGEAQRIGPIRRPRLVYNAICDADANGKALHLAEELIGRMPEIPVVNPPEAVRRSRRDRLAEAAQGIAGIRVPRTVRLRPGSIAEVGEAIRKEKLGYPVLFRPVGTEAGEGLLRLDDAGEMERLEAFPFDGREYYLTEYLEYASSDGMYRKYRCFFIGGEPLPGHLIVAPSWQVHRDREQDGDAYREEEKEFIESFDPDRFRPLGELAERIGLEVAGADFSIDERGTILLFEFNACMHPFSAEKCAEYYSESYTRRVRERMVKFLERKIAERARG
jgi:glutathione synthase/RimK-type ligase-like ATP-grasp enzyme